MKTILITGGTDGMGKGIAMHFLKKGDRVIVVGSSSAKGDIFYNEAKQLGAEGRVIFLQANLSLVKENQRIVEEVKKRFHSLDMLVLCAVSLKFRKTYSETQEGFELTFGLYYLSRYILSYGLKECLEKAENPVIMNICAPGMKGSVNWDDLRGKNNFDSQKAQFHGSRLNDLLGVSFVQNDTIGKIKYILFNPWAVQTSGVMEMYEQPMMKIMMKLMYKIIGKPVQKAIVPIIELLENPPKTSLSAYKQQKEVSLEMETFDKDNAQKLFNITSQLMSIT
ncbi:3-ketoacyl-(acyl-carrier-protein) reductase [Clostridium puniceum]|uniref:3-ketoacyl-(Acyl-carrier-protein) reductase n=1 Tax=Clostridium puniceum TaxID=29367 RepID=A0A1S8TXE8_9CLOT|nr:SDR family NAD(P)-dependent oxidoreductase [Clostridium puniceum]OOM82360.1 3-ketoacyl-(acyl-carrier-protein) reductase [Clostridium puniceum]